MDRKTRHEQFVTGLQGDTILNVYAVTGVCALGAITHHLVARVASQNAASAWLADYVFNWAILLAATTLYANRLPLLAALLFAAAAAAFVTSERRPQARNERAKPDAVVAYRPFLTVYRSAMMVLTCTAILAVDFPAFPRRFAKTETWGTSLMDLGVGSFVFSLGVVSSRSGLRNPDLAFRTEAIASLRQTTKVLALGLVRLIMVKQLDYQEHVSEYGVHWNFFFTLGSLPLFFVVLKRLPPKSITTKACLLAVIYELTLKNAGLLEWALAAPRSTLLSQNKEGITSFAGYLAIFTFGYGFGLKLMNARTSLKSICRTSTQWAVLAQVSFLVLRTATMPSRRLANLPYVAWVVAFNAGFIGLFAICEQLLGVLPSRSYEAVNKHGETVFVLANIGTGLVNLRIDTMALTPVATQGVLVAYQVALMACALFFNRRRRQSA